MREIKFRAWAYKRFYTEGFVIYPSGATEWPEGGWDLHGVDDKIKIEQFTGLHDKNNVEIYEGDIVKTGWHWSKSEDLTQAVEYDSANAVYIPFGTDDWSWDANACEVIGNIHENPELLNGA